MGGFTRRLEQFVRSPQGQRVIDEARRLAKDPARRRQLDELRSRLAQPSARARKP
jgi:hypothetical protein